ncbi:MAG: DUF116 domain-containing protein [Deferribacterales bacterium]
MSKDRAIFMALFFVCASIIFGAGLVIWYLMMVGANYVSSFVSYAVTAIFIVFASSVTLFSALFAYTALTGRDMRSVKGFRRVSTRLTLPFMLRTSKYVGIDKDRLIRAFVNINNDMVRSLLRNKTPKKMLILLPHCIQLDSCELKLTKDISKCTGCGRCDIKNLVNIAARYNISINIATGGTIARRIVKETRPDLILAVACERDLISGIQDTYPLPVLGFCNSRPNGECCSTRIDTDMIENEIKNIYNFKEAV